VLLSRQGHPTIAQRFERWGWEITRDKSRWDGRQTDWNDSANGLDSSVPGGTNEPFGSFDPPMNGVDYYRNVPAGQRPSEPVAQVVPPSPNKPRDYDSD
jgi:hypothetical protein